MASLTALKIGVPSYFYATSPFWQQIAGSSFVIINPNSGPGTVINTDYVATVKAAQAKGALVLGYVASTYSNKSLANFEAEVDLYYKWYGIDGIFIDECATDPTKAPYYHSINQYVKSKGKGFTVINPGTLVPEIYAGVADVIINFESDFASYQAFKPMGWEPNYPITKFCHLIYNMTDPTKVASTLSTIAANHAGYGYITNDTLPNPYDTLPSYFSSEVATK